jgi:hypothetical protein
VRGLLKLRKGVSLVEVLVAMVILLLGIFAMVRLFPTGFTTILYGRNVTEGGVLTHSMIQAAVQNYAGLPDDIEGMTPNGAANPALPIAQELALYQPNANQPPDPRFSDINQARRIIGETTRIPAPTINSPYLPGVPVSVYLLQFGPIYSPVRTKDGLGGIQVYAGNALNRLQFDAPPSTDQVALLDGTNYGIDYQNAVLYFRPVSYARMFKMDYWFTVPQGANTFVRLQAPPGNSVLLPANADQFDMRQSHPLFFPLPQGAQLETNKEALYRGFDALAPNVPFSAADPYQYKVLNPVLGLLGFNPLGATVGVAGAQTSGISAKIDYDVDDWHIIHEDREVPTSSPHQANLTLNGIEQVGDVNEYQEPYTALMTDYANRPSPTPGIDVLVVDTETGLTLDNHTLQPANTANTVMTVNGTVDYRNGIILFNDNVAWTLPNGNAASAPIAGKRIRIYYRTPQDWGVQLTKAATQYYLNPTFVHSGLGYREYGVGTKGYLFFPVQDHDQAVLVDYTWVQDENGQQITRTETGEYHQIADPLDPAGPQVQLGSPTNYWWVRVDRAEPDGAVPGSVRIQRVRGVSVRARAIWREGTRWRSLILDSFVGRDQGT